MYQTSLLQFLKKYILIFSLIFFTTFCNILYAQPGELDLTFNHNGWGFNQGSSIGSINIQKDGKIIVSGDFRLNKYNGNVSVKTVARLNFDGNIDTTFIPTQCLDCAYPNMPNLLGVIGLDNNEKLLVITGNQGHRIHRLNNNGSRDTTFIFTDTTNDYTINQAIIQNNQKIIVVVWSDNTGEYKIIRLNPNGAIDTTFKSLLYIENGARIALQGDGKIIVGKQYITNIIPFLDIVRLNPNGSFDSTFSSIIGIQGHIYCIRKQSDEKIIIAGDFTSINGKTLIRIARLNSNGNLDSTFHPINNINRQVSSILPQSDGKIIITGDFSPLVSQHLYGIARLNNNGSLDSTFMPIGRPVISSIAFQSVDKIIIAGTFAYYNGYSNSIQSQPAIARIESGLKSTDVKSYMPNKSSQISIYPNPSDGIYNVIGENMKSIKIYDLLGKLVHESFSIKDSKSVLPNKSIVDLSNQSNGVFLVEVLTEQGVEYIKILKQ